MWIWDTQWTTLLLWIRIQRMTLQTRYKFLFGYVFFNFIGLLSRLTRIMTPRSSSLELVVVTTTAKPTGMVTAPTQTPATDYTTIWRSAMTATTAETTRRGSTPWPSESFVTVSFKCIIQSNLSMYSTLAKL